MVIIQTACKKYLDGYFVKPKLCQSEPHGKKISKVLVFGVRNEWKDAHSLFTIEIYTPTIIFPNFICYALLSMLEHEYCCFGTRTTTS